MTQTTSDYERARSRLLKKRKVRGDMVSYVIVNACLLGIWAIAGFGYFWPGWVLGVWGVFLALDVWQVFIRHDVTEADIQRELDRIR
jgi:hypothetical protein